MPIVPRMSQLPNKGAKIRGDKERERKRERERRKEKKEKRKDTGFPVSRDSCNGVSMSDIQGTSIFHFLPGSIWL